MATRRKPAVIRRLSLDLGLLVAALCLVFFAIYSYRDVQARERIAEGYVNRNADRALKEYHDTFEVPIKADLNRVREWGASGLLRTVDPFILDKIFKPIIRENDLIHQLDLIDSTGFRYRLRKVGAEWHSHLARPDTLEGQLRHIITNEKGELLGDRIHADPFSVFSEPMISAPDSSNDQIHWSRVFGESELGEEAIAASTWWIHNDQVERTVSMELLLDELIGKVETISNEAPGRVLILNAQGEVLVPPEMDQRDSSWTSLLMPRDQLPEGPIKTALLQFDPEDTDFKAFREKIAKDICWGTFRSVDPGESPVWLGFVVLESELMGLIKADGYDLIFVGAVILIIALVFGWFIVRKYRHQLKDLPGKSIKANSTEQDILDLIARDESATLEFKSTLRKNLRSGKKDKNIEIAALKGIVGFLNTDGGTLLVGVNDDGEIVGTEEDEFENDDKCRLHFKNLFRQHIGMENSKYVDLFLREIQGKKIMIVVCQRAREAVFLKHEGKEIFYIRNGPASEELAPSKVLDRMKGRG